MQCATSNLLLRSTHRSILIRSTIRHASSFPKKYRKPITQEFIESAISNKACKFLQIPNNIQSTKHITSVRLALENNYSNLMKEALKRDKADIARSLFKEYWSFDIQPPSARMINLLFKSHQSLDNIQELVKDSEEILPYAKYLTAETGIQLVQAFSNCGEYEKAETIFNWLSSSNKSSLCIYTFNALLSSANTSQAKTILKQLKDEKISPNLETFSALLGVYSKDENAKDLEDLLTQMLAHNVLPTSFIIAKYLENLANIPQYDNKHLDAHVYQILEQIDLTPDQNILNALALYYSIIISPERAEEFLVECRKEGNIDRNTFSAVFQGFIHLEDFSGGFRFLQSNRSSFDDELVDQALNALLEIAIEQDPVRACEFLEVMDKNSVLPSAEVFDPLLNSLICSENITNFDIVTETWRRATSLGFPIEPDTMAGLIHRADEMEARDAINEFLGYMYDQDMEISDELIEVYNKPVSKYVTDAPFKL